MKLKLLYILLFTSVHSQNQNKNIYKELRKSFPEADDSSMRACVNLGGLFGLKGSNKDLGYTCKFTLGQGVPNDQEAEKVCQMYVPYRIIEVKATGNDISCTFLITKKCEPGWYLIHNKCYKVPRHSLLDLSSAEGACSRLIDDQTRNPKLAVLYPPSVSRFLISAFEIGAAWITVQSFETDYRPGTKLNDGEGTILLDGSAGFYFARGAGANSVINVKKMEKHQYACQYDPPLNVAELSFVTEKYREIYPSFPSDLGVFFSTASFYSINQNGDNYNVSHFHEICRKSGAAFGMATQIEAMPATQKIFEYATKTFLNKARTKGSELPFKYHLPVTRKGGACKNEDFLYFKNDKTSHPVNIKHFDNDDKCYAHAMIVSSGSEEIFAASPNFRAPIACKLFSVRYDIQADVTVCPDGWFEYIRKTGTKFCHKLFYLPNEMRRQTAANYCATQSAFLTGFEDDEELQFLKNLIVKDEQYNSKQKVPQTFFIGVSAFCKDCPTPYWENGVATENDYFYDKFPIVNKYQVPLFFTIGGDKNEYLVRQREHETGFPFCGKYAPFATIVNE